MLLIADVAVFAVQSFAAFVLQRIAGPVTLSLMGPVAAVTGALVAIPIFGEDLPQGFAVAAALVGAGVVLLLWRGLMPFSAARAVSSCR